MIDYSPNYEIIKTSELSGWIDDLIEKVNGSLSSDRWGDLPKWKKVIDDLPEIKSSKVDLAGESICIGCQKDCDDKVRKELEEQLKQLQPWRKGPFDFFGINVETEWRSDMKWDRLKDKVTSLKGRTVLDVGCGNGYHCWRMAGDGAKLVIGIDPTMLYPIQFQAAQKYISRPEVSVFPIGIDDMPNDLDAFDTVFSMGLLYHRRAPFDHLLQLRSFLKEGGELVVETLVIDGINSEVLSVDGRYAKMPNVWFIPSVPTLENWIKRMGFVNVRSIDVSKTTSEEQRVTEWMGFQSLSDFLDPNDNDLTIEGYPAPKRAIFLANKS